jgi:MFS family permease
VAEGDGAAELAVTQPAPKPSAAPEGPWAPLRNHVYRSLWIAVLVSNIGTWMQTVGAQWLLVDEPNASTLVALVQTAGTLPIAFLALPAGVLADSFDRRRLLIGVQLFQVTVALILTVLTAMGEMRPPLLLLLTFTLGCGAALIGPTYLAMVPELLPRSQIPAAAALGSISLNLARAVGPALAGVLVAQVGVAAVFGLNALSFAVFAVVLLAWRREPEDSRTRERFGPALRAGGRYVRHSPLLRRILARNAMFVVPAMPIWALLPLVATERLSLDAGGYGLLLGALGVGAVLGAVLLPRARARLGMNVLIAVSSLSVAASMVLLVLVDSVAIALLALLPAGAGWIGVLSQLGAALQLYLPNWVRARGLAVNMLVLFGSQAVGAALVGVVADHLGLRAAFLGSAAVMALGAATVPLWPLRDMQGLDRTPATYWPEPDLAIDVGSGLGPVLVTVTYTVSAANDAEFQDAMVKVRRSRLRTGATHWELYRDGAAPEVFVEQYLVPSWEEHLRQHSGRLTGGDRQVEERASRLSDPPPVAAHLFPSGNVDRGE